MNINYSSASLSKKYDYKTQNVNFKGFIIRDHEFKDLTTSLRKINPSNSESRKMNTLDKIFDKLTEFIKGQLPEDICVHFQAREIEPNKRIIKLSEYINNNIITVAVKRICGDELLNREYALRDLIKHTKLQEGKNQQIEELKVVLKKEFGNQSQITEQVRQHRNLLGSGKVSNNIECYKRN